MKAKGLLESKTFWTALVAAVVGILYMVLDGQASKEGVVTEIMSVIMVVLRIVTTGPVQVKVPKSGGAVPLVLLCLSFTIAACHRVPALPPPAVPMQPPPVSPPAQLDASTGILSTIAAGLSAPFGCTSGQIKQWHAFGDSVASCLAGTCRLADGLVGLLQSGGWGELLTDQLPCALGCLASGAFGSVAITKGETRQVATWFGTSDEVRTVETYRIRIERPGR